MTSISRHMPAGEVRQIGERTLIRLCTKRFSEVILKLIDTPAGT